MKKFIAGLSLVAFIATLNAKEVKIGLVLPLTGSIAAYGQDVLAGIELANKLDSKLKNGDTVKLVIADTKGDKIESGTAATRLVAQDQVLALIGEAITTNTMQVISVAESKKVPMVAPVASGDKLLEKKKYASRVCFMDSFQGAKFADYAFNELGFKTAIIVIDQVNVYSVGLAKVFEQEFSKKGGKVLKKMMISAGDKDFKAVVSQFNSLNADFVYMPVYHPEAALIAKQARSVGFNKPFGAADGVNNQTFIELGGEAVNGTIFTDSFDYNNPTTKLGRDFIKAYEKEKKTKAVPAFSAMGADAYYVIIEAMNSCANDLNSECINSAIHKTSNFESVGGLINIDQSGNASRSVVIKEIQNGKQVYKSTVNP